MDVFLIIKRCYVSIFLLLIFYSACKKPNNVNKGFEKTFGGSHEDKGIKIQIINESLYVFGSSKSFNDTDGDFYLIKLDLDGNMIWEKTYGGANQEQGRDFF